MARVNNYFFAINLKIRRLDCKNETAGSKLGVTPTTINPSGWKLKFDVKIDFDLPTDFVNPNSNLIWFRIYLIKQSAFLFFISKCFVHIPLIYDDFFALFKSSVLW